jgi:hypothetical protein
MENHPPEILFALHHYTAERSNPVNTVMWAAATIVSHQHLVGELCGIACKGFNLTFTAIVQVGNAKIVLKICILIVFANITAFDVEASA